MRCPKCNSHESNLAEIFPSMLACPTCEEVFTINEMFTEWGLDIGDFPTEGKFDTESFEPVWDTLIQRNVEYVDVWDMFYGEPFEDTSFDPGYPIGMVGV